MSLYFFNVCDGRNVPDSDGTDLPDLYAARRLALRYAGEILDDQARRDTPHEDWHMEATDEAGLILFRFDFHVTDASMLRRDRLTKEH